MKRVYLVFFCAIVAFALKAQDLHYTQFFRVPIALNPAHSGNFDGDYRFCAIHRNQWSGLNATFETSSFSFDMNFKEGILGKDKAGVGLMVTRDQLGDGRFSVFSVAVPLAYHHTLDMHRRHHIHFGANLEMVQKKLNEDGLQFGNQYEDWQFDPSLPSNEVLPGTAVRNFNLSAGMAYTFKIDLNTQFEAGVGLFQLTSPSESVVALPDSVDPHQIGLRYAVTLGLTKKLNDRFTIKPTVLIMQQSKGKDLNLGLIGGYKIGATALTVYGGGFYRLSDAAIGVIGFKYGQIDAMFSHDFTTSGLSDAKNAEGSNGTMVGAWEISLKYIGVLNSFVPSKYTVPCGIF